MRRLPFVLWTLAAALAAGSIAQTPPEKPTLKPADYAQWETLGEAAISPDGHWFAWRTNKVEGDAKLEVRDVDGPVVFEVVNGSAPAFSEDSQWFAYLSLPPNQEAESMRKQGLPVEPRLTMRNLATRQSKVFESVAGFRFMRGAPFLLVHRIRAAERKVGGSELLCVNLTDQSVLSVGDVFRYELNESQTLIAAATDSDGKSFGLTVIDPSGGRVRSLSYGKLRPVAMDWAKDCDTLAYLLAREEESKTSPWCTVFVASGFFLPKPRLSVFELTSATEAPKDHHIAPGGSIAISDDGASVAFGIAPWVTKPKPASGETPNVDVWNTKDIDPYPLQVKQADRLRNKTTLCLWRPETNVFKQVGLAEYADCKLSPDHRYALASNPKPYESSVKVGGIEPSDWISIDVETLRRDIVVRKDDRSPVFSETGRYLAFFRDRNWWVYDAKTRTARNVTEEHGVSFESSDYDGPRVVRPPEEDAEWLQGDAGLVLSDPFDVWLVHPATGNAKKLTAGRSDRVRYRLIDIEDDGEPPSTRSPLYFSMLSLDTMASGAARRDPGGLAKPLVFDDLAIGSFRKARKADRLVFRMESFEKSPNLFVTNGLCEQAKPLTTLNPQQAQYAWGSARLVSYSSRWGVPLHGVLVYPANYQPGGSYPMIVSIYERQSDELHRYRIPSATNAYSSQAWSQNGYFVYLPDIAYRPREPGVSARDCLEPAIDAVLKLGAGVDRKRIGLIGHSWGAYQTVFVCTVSKYFAVGVAGAPLTDLPSMYNSFYWNTGQSNQVLFESEQGRMQVPFWEDAAAYRDNSPLALAHQLKTPLLLATGDADGAVDWHQSLMYYSTLRRMGKNAVLLVYPGENHGLAKKANQKDYARRVAHFLDVHLKGAEPEPWVTQGVPYIQKEASSEPIRPPRSVPSEAEREPETTSS